MSRHSHPAAGFWRFALWNGGPPPSGIGGTYLKVTEGEECQLQAYLMCGGMPSPSWLPQRVVDSSPSSLVIQWSTAPASISDLQVHVSEHGTPGMMETAVAGAKRWHIWLRVNTQDVPEPYHVPDDAPVANDEEHINGEDIFVLDRNGKVRGIYCPSADEENWKKGICNYYHRYIDAVERLGPSDENPLSDMHLADQCLSVSEDGTWYICNHWDSCYSNGSNGNGVPRTGWFQARGSPVSFTPTLLTKQEYLTMNSSASQEMRSLRQQQVHGSQALLRSRSHSRCSGRARRRCNQYRRAQQEELEAYYSPGESDW